MAENVLEYKLVLTPASRKVWLSSWDSNERGGPQIRRASFFPADLNFVDDADVAVLHAVKHSEGLLAKEYVILSQTLHKSNTAAPKGVLSSLPRRTESLNKQLRNRSEQVMTQLRAPAVPRTKSDGSDAFAAEDPQVAAILRASNSGSHYLLASCTRKENPPLLSSASPLLAEDTPKVAHSAASLAHWRRRVFAHAPESADPIRSMSSDDLASRAAGEKRKKGEFSPGSLSPASSGSSPTEGVRYPGPRNGPTRRRPGLRMQSGWRVPYQPESYQMLEGPQSDELPSPLGSALVKVSHPSYWLAARRHSLLLPACLTGSAYELASDAGDSGDAAAAQGRELGVEVQQGTPSILFASEDSRSEDGLRTPGEAEEEAEEFQPSCFSLALSQGREGSPPHTRRRGALGTDRASSPTPSAAGSSSPAVGTATGQLALTRFHGLRGVTVHKPSPPKQKLSNAFVGTPELAIRFYRPGMAGKSFMPPGLRAMGPGEGFVPAEPTTEWVMEGIPSGAFRQLAAFTGLGGEGVAEDGSVVSHVKEDLGSPIALGSEPSSTLIGEPGEDGSGCMMSVYAANPSRAALQMFAEVLPGARRMTFSVRVDATQMTVMQAFAYCLARTDSLVTGGFRL